MIGKHDQIRKQYNHRRLLKLFGYVENCVKHPNVEEYSLHCSCFKEIGLLRWNFALLVSNFNQLNNKKFFVELSEMAICIVHISWGKCAAFNGISS